MTGDGRWQRRRQWTVSSSCPTSATITFLCRESSGAVFLLSGNYISHFSKTLFLHRSKPHLQRLLSWTVAFEIYLIKGELLGKDSFRRGLQTFPPGSYFPIGDIGHYSASCWSPTTFYFIPLFWFFYLRILILSVKPNAFLKSPMIENGDFKLKTEWRNKEDRIGQTAEKTINGICPEKRTLRKEATGQCAPDLKPKNSFPTKVQSNRTTGLGKKNVNERGYNAAKKDREEPVGTRVHRYHGTLPPSVLSATCPPSSSSALSSALRCLP